MGRDPGRRGSRRRERTLPAFWDSAFWQGGPALLLEFDNTRESCRVIGALTSQLEEADAFDAALERVSPYRRTKALAFHFDKDRRTSLLAGLLLDELLQDHGLHERDMDYREGEAGKPAFANRPELQFSLAHSGQMAVAALSAQPVGIDVEYLPAFPYSLADPHTWTEMEAVGKALGCGVGSYVDAGVSGYRRPAGCTVQHFAAGADAYLVCLAVCSSMQAEIV